MIIRKKKITIISEAKKGGGANIAALRIKRNLKRSFKIEGIYIDKNNFFNKIKYYLARILVTIFIKDNLLLNSLNLFSRFNSTKIIGDVILVNWIGKETISLDKLIKINKPIIWICHDLWLGTSTEHFLKNSYQISYSRKDASKNILKKFIFFKKKNFLRKKKISIICNSNWMKNFFLKSELTKNHYIKTIYNPIETNLWKKKNKDYSKKQLNFKIKKKYILLGAHGGLKNYRKGGDLLIESLKYLKKFKRKVEFIILGSEKDEKKIINGFVFNFRRFTANKKKQILYHSVAELTIVPSRAESIPQFAVETLLCENRVVSYDIGGLNEIVNHKVNGYLANPFDTKDFAKGIIYCLNKDHSNKLINSRKKIVKMFDEKKNLKSYSKEIKKLF